MRPDLIMLLTDATLQTLYMAAAAALFGTLAGFPLGVFLATSAKGELFELPRLNEFLKTVINAACSTPFIVLAVAITPITRAITGTSIGATAAIVPLSIAATPLIAKSIETAIREVDQGLIEACRAMGATPRQIVLKVLLPEARPGILLGLTLTAVSLLGNSAIVGAVGGGGLGDLSMRFGYQRFTPEIMAAVVIVLIVLVQTIQISGQRFARRTNKRIGRI